MPEYTVEWHGNEWEPTPVFLAEIRAPWTHPLYRNSTLDRDVPEARRPQAGWLISHPETHEDMALVVRIAPDPPGERLTYRCIYMDDQQRNREVRDYLVSSRRWIPVRPEGTVIRATPALHMAIKDAIQPFRLPVEPPEYEAGPEGDDLIALEGLR